MLITRDDLKEELGLNTTEYDSLLDSLARAVEDLWNRLTEREWLLKEHTELRRCSGDGIVLLRNYPVREVLHVWEDDREVKDEDFSVDWENGILYYPCSKGSWLKIVYRAGYDYDEFPESIRRVLIRQACYWFMQAKNHEWHVRSRTDPAGGGGITYGVERNLLPELEELAERERRMR